MTGCAFTVLNALWAEGQLCLLLDFGKPRLQIKRVVDGLYTAPNHLRVSRASDVLSAQIPFLSYSVTKSATRAETPPDHNLREALPQHAQSVWITCRGPNCNQRQIQFGPKLQPTSTRFESLSNDVANATPSFSAF